MASPLRTFYLPPLELDKPSLQGKCSGEKKYPVIYREIKNLGRQYIDGRLGIDTLEELARWIDSLDRL